MKAFRSIVCIVVALFATTAPAATVNDVVFTLDSPGNAGGVNNLNMTLNIYAYAQTQNSVLSGTIRADIEIDNAGNVSQLNLGSPNSLTATNFGFTVPPNAFPVSGGDSLLVQGSNLTASAATIDPTVTGGMFLAQQHEILLDGGQFRFIFTNGVISYEPFGVWDLETDPFSLAGFGTGTISSTQVGPNQYQLVLSIPVLNSNIFQSESSFLLINDGTIRATAIVTVSAVPEPSSGIFLASAAAGMLTSPRRRSRKG